MKKADYIAKYGEEAYEKYLEKQRERSRRYNQTHKEERSEQNKQYRQNNRERIKENQKQWYQDNKEDILVQRKQYNQEHKEEIAEHFKQYYETQHGRAVCMCNNYQQTDKKQNRGDCTLTPDYIVDHIFPNGCLYCGEKDWIKLGCDRVDNDLPHTPDNVVCCCADCNKKRSQKGFDMFLNMAWRKRFA